MKKVIINAILSILLQLGVYIYIGVNYGKEPVLLLLCIDFYRDLSNSNFYVKKY